MDNIFGTFSKHRACKSKQPNEAYLEADGHPFINGKIFLNWMMVQKPLRMEDGLEITISIHLKLVGELGFQVFSQVRYWLGVRSYIPGTPNNQLFDGCLVKQAIFNVMIWFIIQLKQPCINRCLEPQVYVWTIYNDQTAEVTSNGGLVGESPKNPLKSG